MDTPSAHYDFNFRFPVPRALDSERVQLVPLILSSFSALQDTQSFLFDQIQLYPDLLNYLPFGPFKDVDDFVINLLEYRGKDPGILLFAVYDKTKPAPATADDAHPGALAGMIGFSNSSIINLVTEIGTLVILPPFQRTHVTSNAVGLLLKYALNLPSPLQSDTFQAPTGLGLRRVSWQANIMNEKSVLTAKRMGFQFEGVLRWDRVLPASKEKVGAGNGIPLREGDSRSGCVERDTVMLALYWDDWENGGREKVESIMRRVE